MTAGPSDTISNRSLTRASLDETEDYGIRRTTWYTVSFEERVRRNERNKTVVGRE